MNEDQARDGLSTLLPEVVDDLTPDGRLPSDEQRYERIDQYSQQLRR